MTGGHEILQLIKMVGKNTAKTEKNDKKMKMMATAIQNITKEPQREDGEIHHNKEMESHEREEEDDKKKEEEAVTAFL